MPGLRLALIPLAAALAAVLGSPRPAAAQCRLCEAPVSAAPQAEDERALEISIDADLDFDRLLLAGDSGGSGRARLDPDGTRLASGSIASIGGRAVVGRVALRGMPGRPVSIDLPKRVELFGIKGGRLIIEELISDLPDEPKLDSNGELTFRIGGDLLLEGDADGEYRGSVPIAVDYL